MKCGVCDGEGFTVEHDLKCDGSCGSCPVQVQCETCRGTGEIKTYTEEELQEAIQEERESIIQECEWIKKQYEHYDTTGSELVEICIKEIRKR